MPEKLGWKEKFAAAIALIIGLMFLAQEITSLASPQSYSYRLNGNSIFMNRRELFADIRTWITALLGILGFVLLISKKRSGWIVAMSMLSLFWLITIAILVSLAISRIFDESFIIVSVVWLTLTMAIAFLVRPAGRQKFRVSRQTVLLTLVMLLSLSALYYFLQ